MILLNPKFKADKMLPGIITRINSRAYSSVFSLPPNSISIGSMKILENTITTPVIMKVSIRALASIFSARSLSPSPNRMEIRDAAPAPTSMLKADRKFINGKVSANPEMAIGPTPCPMNIRSIMLYSEAIMAPTIAGKEYIHNNLRTFMVPNLFSTVVVILNFYSSLKYPGTDSS